MIDTIYIEEAVLSHDKTEKILARFPKARRVVCERYGEIFNRKSQSFRAQKIQPSLVLAQKHQNFVLEAPANYGVGGKYNFYFSHMMNCLYDCRYCFLQGMYRSAHYVVFVNYEDFDQGIVEKLAQTEGEETWFFSGYDCDSLALEPVTDFIAHTLDTFPKHKNAWLELRTKSTQVRALLARPVLDNCVVAYSISPKEIIDAYEHKTPSLENRLNAALKLQQAGWKIGLRFDPVIYHADFEQIYATMFNQVFARLEADKIHSVSLGGFRLPESFYKSMVKMHPYEVLFAGPLEKNEQAMMAYKSELERSMLAFCEQEILKHINADCYFPCTGDMS